MSQTKEKTALKDAELIANNFIGIISPHCERVQIAGSIRRKLSFVNDIEIVCEPKKIPIGANLFGGIAHGRDKAFIMYVKAIGENIRGSIDTGKYVQMKLAAGMNMDIFMPAEHDYYRQLAIRTGPVEFVVNNISAGWRRLGWCGTDDGLRRTNECEQYNCGTKWTCISDNPTLPPKWKSEEEFFEWLKLKWISPERRNS